MIDALRDRLGEKVSTNPSVLDTHGRDEGYPEEQAPVAVVLAESASDVRDVLQWASQHRVPVIPFGAGTSLEGQLIPRGPAVTLDLSRMNRILQIAPEDFVAVVEPGLTYQALNRALRRNGLFFPVDPGADASLGGMAATNASGTMGVRYGNMRQNTLALEVVLATGDTLRLGRAVRKTSSGYDLKDLFIGSEGTLGVITELAVKLHPLPSHVYALRAFFKDVSAAAEAAYLIMAGGLPVARMELLDELSLRAVNRYLNRTYLETPALFLEFHSGSASALEGEVAEATRLVQETRALTVETARGTEDLNSLWEARHRAYWAFIALHPGLKYLTTDTAVPLSKMAPLVRYARQRLDAMQLDGSIIGHVGDGNFHVVVAVSRDDYPKAEEFASQLVQAALEAGGTATGEHGIGLRKKGYLAIEHSTSLPWMRQLKRLFDPLGLLNPGKVFDL